MKKAGISSIQVIDRVARLLDVLAASAEPMSLKLLSAETELHPSTAFRILNALAAHRHTDTAYAEFGLFVVKRIPLLRHCLYLPP